MWDPPGHFSHHNASATSPISTGLSPNNLSRHLLVVYVTNKERTWKIDCRAVNNAQEVLFERFYPHFN